MQGPREPILQNPLVARAARVFAVAWAAVGMVVAQVFATIAIGIAGIAAFRRFPATPTEPLGEDVRAIRGFLFSSTLASSLDSARGTLGTSLVPTVAPIVQAGYFRNAQAPATSVPFRRPEYPGIGTPDAARKTRPALA